MVNVWDYTYVLDIPGLCGTSLAEAQTPRQAVRAVRQQWGLLKKRTAGAIFRGVEACSLQPSTNKTELVDATFIRSKSACAPVEGPIRWS